MIELAEAVKEPPSDLLQEPVSASRLSLFHSCRLKFFFRYVEKLQKPMSPPLFLGRMVHALLQLWSNERWKGKPHSLDSLKEALDLHWILDQEEEPVAWENNEEEQRQKAWNLLEMYLRDTPILPDEKPLAVEVKVEADLSSHGLPSLRGVIDLVRPGGVIVDFKTAASTPDPLQVIHRNEIQLTAYGLLYRDATGERERGFELHHLIKTKVPKLVVSQSGPISQTQETKLLRSIESYVEGVQRKDWIPSPGLQCASCEFFEQCSLWKGGV
jgi:CRISPR/Cas system-associated exonuclease Cas4 (RecB family)